MPQRLDDFLGDSGTTATMQAPATAGPMRLDDYLGGGAATPMQPTAPVRAPAPARQHGAVGNAVTAALNTIEPYSNAAIRTLGRTGIISPERAQAAIQNQIFTPDAGTTSAKIGTAVGGLVPLLAGPYAPAMYGISAAENAKERQEQRMANGEQISGWQQAGDVAAQAAIGYGFGKLAPGGRISKALLGNVPGGVVGRLIGAGAIGAGENVVQQAAGNASAKYLGGEQNRDLTEGTGEAGQIGAFFGAAGQGGHEVTHNVLQAMRERQSAGAPPTPPLSDFNPQLQQHGSSPESVQLDRGTAQPQSAQPSQAGLKQAPNRASQGTESAHPFTDRLPGTETESTPKTQPDNQMAPQQAVPPQGGETTGERRVFEAIDKHLDENGPVAPTAPGEQRVLDAMDRAGDRHANPEPEAPQRQPGVQRLDEWNKSETPGDQRVMDAFDRKLDASAANAEPPSAGDQKVYDAMERAGQRSSNPDESDMKLRPTERLRDTKPTAEAEAPAVPTEDTILAKQKDFLAAQAANDPKADHLAAEVQQHLMDYEGQHGEDKAEDLIAKVQGMKHEPEPTPIQKLMNKGKEATPAEPTEKPKPEFGSDQWKAAMGRASDEFKSRSARKSLTDRPGFISIPDSKFAERDVQPAAKEFAAAAKKSWGAVNRFLGTGASWNTGDRDTANRISSALSEHDRAMAQAEHTLAPHREAMADWSDKAKAQWIDAVEGSGVSPDPKHQSVADFNNTLNENNIKEGKLYGLNTKKWEGDYIGRLAEFPEDKQAGTGGAGRTTMAGAQNFLKGRVFDTFSDFKKFVEDHGGKLKYDNPMDMLLAKQTEIQRSIMARKAMYTEDNRGQLKWVPDGQKPPEGFDRALRDPLASQERRQILPSSTVARIAQMSHYQAKEFLDGPEVQKAAQWLRPGTDLPKDWSYSGEKQAGTYHGNANVADQFNNLISSGLKKDVPVLHQAAAAVKGTTSMALNLSGVHYAIESIRNASLAASRAVEAAVGGDFSLASKNLKLMNPLAANKLGAQYREQYADPSAHPHLESQVQGSVEGGAPFSLKSVLDKNHFEDMKTEWKAGNKVGAGLRMVKGISEAMHGPLFNHFVPNLKAAAAGMAAAQAESKGLSGLAKQRYMSLAHDNIENNLGMVARNRQFQNRIVTDVQDLVMLAPKFAEGLVRNAGAAVRDTATALKDVAQGKKPEFTPSMYTAVAHLVTHATLAAMTQVAYTTATTGKPIFPSSPMDLLKPKTGRKDDQGRDERLTLPTPVAMAYGLATGGGKAITSRVAPIWHTLYNEGSNVDENNVEIRHKGDSILKQMRDSAAYAVKGSSPFSIQNVMQGNRPGQPHGVDKAIGELAGVHTSYVPSSNAEAEARSALFEKGRANPMTQEQYDRQQERGKIREEFTGKNPQASSDLAADLKSGKLAQSDRVALMKQNREPAGLPGELKKMQAEQIMDRVWPKMTAEEKQKNQWLVRGMIGRSTTLTGAQKQQLWTTIKSETAGAK